MAAVQPDQNVIVQPLRELAFFMAMIMERGEPHEAYAAKYMVRVTALDGGPLILSLSMATTVTDLNIRLAEEFGAGVVHLGQVNAQGAVVDIGPGFRPIDVDDLEVEMALAVREE